MASDGDEYWRRTQVMLQGGDTPLVRKPKLTENLLRKPPFRFLHDVISEVQRQTGFAPGLFSETEQNSSNVKDKQSKVDYLNKIIDFVAETLGRPRAAKALKVVAGLEPENTNRFLQELAEAATGGRAEEEQQDSGTAADESTEHVETGDHDDMEMQSTLPSKFGLDVDAEGMHETQHRSQQGLVADVQMPMGDHTMGRPSSRGHMMNQRDTMTSRGPAMPESPSAGEGRQQQLDDDARQQTWSQIEHDSRQKHQPPASPPHTHADAGRHSIEPPFPRQPDLSSAALDAQLQSFERAAPVPAATRFIRPSSARRGPPRLVKQTEGSGNDGIRRTVGGEQSATAVNAGPTIIADDDDDDDDIEEDLIAMMPEGESEFNHAGASDGATGAETDGAVAGKLVSNMIAEKDQLEQQARSINDTSTANEQESGAEEKPTGIVLRRRLSVTKVGGEGSYGEKPQKKADLKTLRDSIQNLCQHTAPLTKTLDFIQEDIDNMNKELQHWTNETKLHSKLHGRHEGSSGGMMGGHGGSMAGDRTQFKTTIAELDMDIVRQREKIHGARAQILRNDQRIAHLLQVVVNGSSTM